MVEETCPYCGCKITSGSLTCLRCGKSLPAYPVYPSSVTTVSGETYEFTSGSTATMAFTHISDQYQEDQYAKIPEVQIVHGKTVTKEDLIYYEK
jgi:L-lactate utilization protein LutB